MDDITGLLGIPGMKQPGTQVSGFPIHEGYKQALAYSAVNRIPLPVS